MTIDVTRLSKDTKSLIGQWDRFVKKGGMMLLRMYESMRKDGLDPFEARDYIKEITDASQRQLQRALPDEAKHIEKRHKPQIPMTTNVVINKQETSNNKEIEIPVKHTIHDAPVVITAGETLEDDEHMIFRRQIKADRPLTEEERNKVQEIMTQPQMAEVILDCNKFRTDLRTGLLNSAKLKLQVKNNEVVKVV